MDASSWRKLRPSVKIYALDTRSCVPKNAARKCFLHDFIRWPVWPIWGYGPTYPQQPGDTSIIQLSRTIIQYHLWWWEQTFCIMVNYSTICRSTLRSCENWALHSPCVLWQPTYSMCTHWWLIIQGSLPSSFKKMHLTLFHGVLLISIVNI